MTADAPSKAVDDRSACGGVLFAVFQNGSRANGGVESITQVIEGLIETPRLVVTNAETSVTKRWRGA